MPDKARVTARRGRSRFIKGVIARFIVILKFGPEPESELHLVGGGVRPLVQRHSEIERAVEVLIDLYPGPSADAGKGEARLLLGQRIADRQPAALAEKIEA